MTLSQSPRAYDDCYVVLDRVLEEEIGVKVKVSDQKEAIHFKNRCNYARKLDRQKNCQIYEMDHAMFNASMYDGIKITWENTAQGWFVIFEKYESIAPTAITSLGSREATEEEA